ncbi:uncharacterized protein [Watersipora subatra]|uniref:uncharacterized protein n=1 Tax=Watersipora subatra TaxID=2589382 RepID=UPI00355BAFBC
MACRWVRLLLLMMLRVDLYLADTTENWRTLEGVTTQCCPCSNNSSSTDKTKYSHLESLRIQRKLKQARDMRHAVLAISVLLSLLMTLVLYSKMWRTDPHLIYGEDFDNDSHSSYITAAEAFSSIPKKFRRFEKSLWHRTRKKKKTSQHTPLLSAERMSENDV